MPEDFPKSRGDFPLPALKRAELLGTLNKIDRRPQYSSPQHAKPEALLEAVNELGNNTRGVQKDLGQIQRQVFNLKLRNAIVVAVVTGALARAPEIAAWLVRLFQ